MSKEKQDLPAAKGDSAKKKRLAAALRANLQRRKAKERDSSAESSLPPDGTIDGDD